MIAQLSVLVRNHVANLLDLGGDDEVLIARGFLKHVVDIYKKYCALLSDSIVLEQKAK